jgi:hypothetical protein
MEDDQVRFWVTANKEVGGRVIAKSYFGTVDSKHSRSSAGRSACWNYLISGQKAQFHQPTGYILRQIQPIQDASLTGRQIR